MISIIIPVHNAAPFIRQTIDSVLGQTYSDFELLLVEDASTDGTLAIMEKYKDPRIRVLVNPGPHKACHARNLGIREAQGDHIAFLDADDLWHKRKLEKTLKFMMLHNAGFAFTAYEFGDSGAVGTGKIVHVPEVLDYEAALTRTIIFTSTVMFDLSKIGKDDIYMPEIKSEDTATWWRILRSGKKAYGLNENLVIYRRAGKSLSSNKIEALRRIWHLYRVWEGFGFFKSARLFVGWAIRASARRL